jgi:hypothetical protein
MGGEGTAHCKIQGLTLGVNPETDLAQPPCHRFSISTPQGDEESWKESFFMDSVPAFLIKIQCSRSSLCRHFPRNP